MDGGVLYLHVVLSSYFPHRWKDLCQYQPLILQTHPQFPSRIWLSYDRAFCQHAAANNLVDRSSINVQLFNFHVAGPSVRGRRDVPSGSSEPSVLALRESCAGCGAGDSALHLVRPAGLPIVVPAVFWGSPCLLLPWSSI